jgi:dTDP-4-dehydrorhamnose reductase
MKILVTGANGLLGQKLCTLLAADPSVELVATARDRIKFTLSSGAFIPMDVTLRDHTMQVIQGVRPDVVIHTAAMTQVDQCESEKELCWLSNVTAVAHVVSACEAVEAHLIHISTDFIFDGTRGPLDESEKPNPISYYGESKLAGEVAAQQCKSGWAILRTVLVYGVTPDMSRSNIVLWVKKSLEEGKKINVVNDQWRTPTLAEDLAMGCMLAARKKAQGIYNISGEVMMTPWDIAQATAAFFKLDASLIQPAHAGTFKQPAARPPRTGFVIEKAKRELGYRPHSFSEGLAVIQSQL